MHSVVHSLCTMSISQLRGVSDTGEHGVSGSGNEAVGEGHGFFARMRLVSSVT